METNKLHTPCANIIQEKIDELNKEKDLISTFWKGVTIKTLERLLPQVRAIEENSVENLFEQLPTKNEGNYLVLKKYICGYKAYYPNFENKSNNEGEGKAPQLALLALKEKLSNQK